MILFWDCYELTFQTDCNWLLPISQELPNNNEMNESESIRFVFFDSHTFREWLFVCSPIKRLRGKERSERVSLSLTLRTGFFPEKLLRSFENIGYHWTSPLNSKGEFLPSILQLKSSAIIYHSDCLLQHVNNLITKCDVTTTRMVLITSRSECGPCFCVGSLDNSVYKLELAPWWWWWRQRQPPQYNMPMTTQRHGWSIPLRRNNANDPCRLFSSSPLTCQCPVLQFPSFLSATLKLF